jgi:signal transduction histidine kinase
VELLRGPTRADVAIATILIIYTVFEIVTLHVIQPKGPALVTGVLGSALMAYRRVHPLLVAAGLAIPSVAVSLAGVPIDASGTPLFTWILTVFAVVTLLDWPRALLGMGIFLVSMATSGGLANASLENMVFGLTFAGLAFAFGLSVRRRTSEAVRLREDVLRHEASLEREGREAADRERSRIARELHDVISHSVSVMVVQAGAAERVLAADAGAAARAMQAVQLTGRQALTELAGLLGVLRSGSDDIGLAPQPGLAAPLTTTRPFARRRSPPRGLARGSVRPGCGTRASPARRPAPRRRPCRPRRRPSG